jgi:outer membrane protein insertion porin family
MLRFLLILFNLLFFNHVALSEVITDVSISGNKRISKETIVVLGKIDLNSDYDNEKLNLTIKDLFDSGFFNDVSLDINNGKLNISVVENPIIEEIIITGIKEKNFIDLILTNITLKTRKSFSENLLQKDKILIDNILKTSGYYFSKIEISTSINQSLNSVIINININTGNKAKISNISFIGDKKIKDKKLLEVITSEEKKFWKFLSQKVYLNQSTINLDKRLLENFYKNNGYYNVKILDSFVQLDTNSNFDLIFNISAGRKYYFNDLKINLPVDYNVNNFSEINKTLTKLKGKLFNLNDFNKILKEIDRIASSKLYEFIDAKVDEEIIEGNKLNFTFNVVDSTKFYVERINIFGNFQTLEEVIRNKFIVDEGDPLNNLLLNKSLDNIRSLNIFKNVNTEIKEGSNPNFKIIDIDVEEMPTGEISLAAGTGTSGTTIGGGIIEKNFLGKGINLNTNLELSEDAIKGQFIYSKPNFAYTDNTLSTSLIATTSDFLTDYGYKVSKTGLSIGTTFEQYENFFFSPETSISFENLETNANASAQLKKQKGSYQDMYFNYGINYDLRDSKYRPTAGNTTQFYQNIPLLSESNELTNTFIFSQYKKFSQNSDTVGRASVYFKAVNSLDNSDVRISKRGQVPYNRLRGFEKGKIGPVDNDDFIGGNYVGTLNLSTNLPGLLSTVENVDFSYFIDVANVWGVDYDDTLDDSNKIRSSTGVGMNLLTPIGPLSFSLAQPLTKSSTDKTESFRFNLGTTF